MTSLEEIGLCENPEGHNCIPAKRWFRRAWWCVRCTRWFRVDVSGWGRWLP